MAQGLCFAASHCNTGSLALVGATLGFLSVVGIILPLLKVIQEEDLVEGLRIAHWPITEALPAARSPITLTEEEEKFNAVWKYCLRFQKERKKDMMGVIISGITKE